MCLCHHGRRAALSSPEGNLVSLGIRLQKGDSPTWMGKVGVPGTNAPSPLSAQRCDYFHSTDEEAKLEMLSNCT